MAEEFEGLSEEQLDGMQKEALLLAQQLRGDKWIKAQFGTLLLGFLAVGISAFF